MRTKSLFLPYLKFVQLAGSPLRPVKVPDVTGDSTRRGYCDVCYLFYGKNLARPYKCSKVQLICSACVKRKRFVPVMGTTWMLPGHLKQIYIRPAVM